MLAVARQTAEFEDAVFSPEAIFDFRVVIYPSCGYKADMTAMSRRKHQNVSVRTEHWITKRRKWDEWIVFGMNYESGNSDVFDYAN